MIAKYFSYCRPRKTRRSNACRQYILHQTEKAILLVCVLSREVPSI